MVERKEKIFHKRWFCNHNYKCLDDMRGFFGITQCVKCGEWRRLPDDQMTTTVLPPFKIRLDESNPKE